MIFSLSLEDAPLLLIPSLQIAPQMTPLADSQATALFTHLRSVTFHLLENPRTSQHYIKGAKTDPLNYRHISWRPIITKVMEFIITADMKSFLFSKNLISDHQFGFRPDLQSLLMDLDKIWWTGWACDEQDLIRFWWRSRSRCGSENLSDDLSGRNWEIRPKTII